MSPKKFHRKVPKLGFGGPKTHTFRTKPWSKRHIMEDFGFIQPQLGPFEPLRKFKAHRNHNTDFKSRLVSDFWVKTAKKRPLASPASPKKVQKRLRGPTGKVYFSITGRVRVRDCETTGQTMLKPLGRTPATNKKYLEQLANSLATSHGRGPAQPALKKSKNVSGVPQEKYIFR